MELLQTFKNVLILFFFYLQVHLVHTLLSFQIQIFHAVLKENNIFPFFKTRKRQETKMMMEEVLGCSISVSSLSKERKK